VKRTALVVFTVHSLSLGGDSWFGSDKVKHFFLGSFIQSAAFGGLRATGLGKRASIAGASAATIVMSVGKELRDRNGSGTPSLRDVVWGLAGGAAISPLLLRAK
jgi:uncharacterized protein YfiM (DUF2279 family)